MLHDEPMLPFDVTYVLNAIVNDNIYHVQWYIHNAPQKHIIFA